MQDIRLQIRRYVAIAAVVALTLRNRQSIRLRIRGRLAGRVLVGGFVLAHDLGADPAALGDRQSRFPGPGPDSRAIDTSTCGQLRRAPTAGRG